MHDMCCRSARVRNKNRTPLRSYTTARRRSLRPIIAAYVSTPSSTTADSITASLAVSGTNVATTQFVLGQRVLAASREKSHCSSTPRRDLTGPVPLHAHDHRRRSLASITRRPTPKYRHHQSLDEQVWSGQVAQSHELDLYEPNGNVVLWVGGDGSWLKFSSVYPGFAASGLAFGLQTIYLSGGGPTRRLPDQTSVWYGGSLYSGAVDDIAGIVCLSRMELSFTPPTL